MLASAAVLFIVIALFEETMSFAAQLDLSLRHLRDYSLTDAIFLALEHSYLPSSPSTSDDHIEGCRASLARIGQAFLSPSPSTISQCFDSQTSASSAPEFTNNKAMKPSPEQKVQLLEAPNCQPLDACLEWPCSLKRRGAIKRRSGSSSSSTPSESSCESALIPAYPSLSPAKARSRPLHRKSRSSIPPCWKQSTLIV